MVVLNIVLCGIMGFWFLWMSIMGGLIVFLVVKSFVVVKVLEKFKIVVGVVVLCKLICNDIIVFWLKLISVILLFFRLYCLSFVFRNELRFDVVFWIFVVIFFGLSCDKLNYWYLLGMFGICFGVFGEIKIVFGRVCC